MPEFSKNSPFLLQVSTQTEALGQTVDYAVVAVIAVSQPQWHRKSKPRHGARRDNYEALRDKPNTRFTKLLSPDVSSVSKLQSEVVLLIALSFAGVIQIPDPTW